MPLHRVAPQPWSCCSSPGALTTWKEVKPEVWLCKKEKHPCKAPPLIFKDQVHLPEKKDWHMDSPTTEVHCRLCSHRQAAAITCDRGTLPTAEQGWLVLSSVWGQSCTHTATQGGAGENSPAHNHRNGWEELGKKKKLECSPHSS